jgi:cytidine deaminase
MGSQINLNILIELAWQARTYAYAPFSRCAVGATLVAKSEKIFFDCKVENILRGFEICAEKVFGPASAGCRRFAGVTSAAQAQQFTMPCEAYRQVLSEFRPPYLRVASAERRSQSRNSLSAFAHRICVAEVQIWSTWNSFS